MEGRRLDFEAFIRDIESARWRVHGVEVYSDDRLRHSWGDTQDTKYDIYSATKSVLSVAVGIAQDMGMIDLERCVLDYMPAAALDGLSPQQRDAFRRITLHRLMTMSVPGFPFRPEGENYLRFALNCPDIRPEAQRFAYGNIPACLTGIALQQAVGEDAWAFIRRRVLEPLGIAGAVCARCPEGWFYGASGMKLSVNDLSRIGRMLCSGGTFNGVRIVSEAYVRKATSALQDDCHDGYGYLFRRWRDGFSINGKWKQRCYVLPRSGLVIAFLSDIREGSDALIDSMARHLLQDRPVDRT